MNDINQFSVYNIDYSISQIKQRVKYFKNNDYELISKLASFGMTQKQIGIAIKINEAEFKRLYDEDPKFKVAIDEGKTDLHMSILAAQLQMALPDPEAGYIGNAAMLKHIGNIHLGQADKLEVKEEKNINVVLRWGNTKLPKESTEQSKEIDSNE